MTIKPRFVKGVIATASTTDTAMPWARGKRRAAFIAKRKKAEAGKAA